MGADEYYRLISQVVAAITSCARTILDPLRAQLPGATLWRRQMVLGPGKEFALIVPPGLDVAAPAGWSAFGHRARARRRPLIRD